MVALSLMAGRVETGNAVLSPNGWHKSATISLVQTTPGGTKVDREVSRLQVAVDPTWRRGSLGAQDKVGIKS